MYQEHHIVTQKTARIFTYGQLTEKTKMIWLVAHGYGMLSEFFIKKFNCLDIETNFIIVPEALSKFYTNGLGGRVGASWMTKEDRQNEINDQYLYLEKVYETFILHSNVKITIFGFSQGVATISRWANKTNKHIDNLVFWAASLPPELVEKNNFESCKKYFLIGDEDEFIKKEDAEILLKQYNNIGLINYINFYKGGHTILTEPLLELSKALTHT